MEAHPNPPPISISQARRTGGIVFFIGSCLQGLAFLLILSLIILVTFRFNKSDAPQNSELRDYLEELVHNREIYLAAFGGVFVMVIASWQMGNWAGPAIGIRKRRFGWVGILAAIIPSVFGSLIFCLSAVQLMDDVKAQAERDIFQNLIVPFVGYSGIFYLAGSVTSILSGLVVRQRLRVLEERAIKQSKLEANEF
jgi:MFS family permease